MTYNIILIFLILFVVLIGIDIAVFSLRRNKYTASLLSFSIILSIIERIKTWLQNYQSTSKNTLTATPNPALGSRKISETIYAGDKDNPVHIEISADIPEGTTVEFTLKVVNSKKKTTTQKRSLTHEIPQKTKSTQSVPEKTLTKPKRKKNLTISALQEPAKSNLRQWIAAIRQMGFKQTIHWSLLPENVGWVLLGAAIIVYAIVISFGIERFPIYFFTDEAIHMNMASDFIRDHFQNYDHEFMPTFFIAEGWVNGTSVYVQVLPYLLFGKSIAATRLVSALITLVAALTLGLVLKQVFKIKYHWAGVLLLLTTPAWFFHARTAFEYAEVGSFYMMFLYFYSRYRGGHLTSFYAAIITGALCFYTHGLGQMLMAVTGLALFVVDFRYHFHADRRKTVLYGLGLGLILFLPFVRYYLAHSNESLSQVKRRGSYWYDDELTTLQKTWEFIKQYAYGLNPQYWYFHNPIDIARHVMKDYGDGLLITLPFAIIGFILVIKNLRRTPYHIALIAFLAAPLPASIVAVGMPRMLWMSIPIAIMTTLGLSFCLEWLEMHWKKLSNWLPWMMFILLTSLSVFMLRDALVNGPLWFDDYGLYGMQYGAKQIFEETIVPELKKNPDLMFVVSPSWANGTDKFADFFIPKDLLPHVTFGQPDNHVTDPGGITPNTRFILPYNEYDNLLTNPKFKDIVVHQIIPYPNGKPGFYIVSLKIADNIDSILAAEKLINITPIEETMELDGQEVRVLHSPFGSGGLIHVFDNDPDTLAKVLEANPFVFDLYPTNPINTTSVVIQTGSLPDFTVTISLYAPGSSIPEIYTKTFKGLPPDPIVTMDFDKGPSKSERIYIEIKDNVSGESSQIHVRQIKFN